MTNIEIAREIVLIASDGKEDSHEKMAEGLARATKDALTMIKNFMDKATITQQNKQTKQTKMK